MTKQIFIKILVVLECKNNVKTVGKNTKLKVCKKLSYLGWDLI